MVLFTEHVLWRGVMNTVYVKALVHTCVNTCVHTALEIQRAYMCAHSFRDTGGSEGRQ